jgi:hypothetical protein
MPGVTGAGTAAVKLAQRLVGQEGAAVELLAEAMSAHGFDARRLCFGRCADHQRQRLLRRSLIVWRTPLKCRGMYS